MIEELKKCFIDNRNLFGRNMPAPGTGDVLAIKTGDSTEKTVRFHLFLKNGSGPVCVAKLVRDRQNADVLQQEFNNLRLLNRRLETHEQLSHSIPKPVGLFDVQGETVLLLAFTPGASLERLLAAESLLPWRGRKVQACIKQLRHWLLGFQGCAMESEASTLVPGPKSVASLIRSECTSDSGWMIGKLDSAYKALAGIQYTPVPCHGKLSPRSVIVSGQQGNHIVDWEEYHESGHPLDDALDLVFSTIATMSPWTSKQAGHSFSSLRASLQDALLDLISVFRRSANLSPEQTHLYMLLHAAGGLDRAVASRDYGQRTIMLNLLRNLLDEEKQIVSRLNAQPPPA